MVGAGRSLGKPHRAGRFPEQNSVQHEVFLVELPDGRLQVAFIDIGDACADKSFRIGSVRPQSA